MGRRSSVNQKIELLLESSVREQFETNSVGTTGPAAERIIARRQLYGVGTSGDLPSVKRGELSNSKSAMEIASRTRSPTTRANSPPNYLSSSQSVGGNSISTMGTHFPFFGMESSLGSISSTNTKKKKRKKQIYGHEGMYNVITHQGDPERVYHDTSASEDGPQNFPPWYVGYLNSTSKPSDIPSVSSRYGNRGAYNMKLRTQNAVPVDSVNEYTPKLNSVSNVSERSERALCQKRAKLRANLITC